MRPHSAHGAKLYYRCRADNFGRECSQTSAGLEQLTLIPDDELHRDPDILQDFTARWNAFNEDRKAQRELTLLIVARIKDARSRVVVLSLRPNYHITLGPESEKSTEILVDSREDIMGDDIIVDERERRAWIAFKVRDYHGENIVCGSFAHAA